MKRRLAAPSNRTQVLSALCALWILLAPGSAAAEDLGRLFFTPQQRQELDRRREANIQESGTFTVENTMTVNGHVARSSGRTTTWINGVPQYDSHQTRDPARVTVGGSEGEPPVDVKIGQTLDKTRGEVKDELGGGRITIRRGAQGPAGN
jgi:hypothetical protein